jgi:hypothetical protein
MAMLLQNTPHAPQKKLGSWLKVVLITVAILVVLGVGFTACGASPKAAGPTAPFLLRATMGRIKQRGLKDHRVLSKTLTIGYSFSAHNVYIHQILFCEYFKLADSLSA